jgi:hypothetical protein
MRIEPEDALRRIALGCGFFLLFGPIGGRTTWVGRNGSYTADAMGYNMTALFSGVVAIAALAFAFWARPRVILTLLGIVAALAAFGLSVLASGVYVWARLQGEVWMYAIGGFAGKPGRNDTLHYAPGPPFFALAAIIGAVATLVLAITWLRQPKSV